MRVTTGAVPPSISTDGAPERDGVAVFREEVARRALRLDVEPLGNDPFHAAVTSLALPGLRAIHWEGSSVRLERTRQLIPPDDNAVGLVVCLSESGMFSQGGREVALRRGDAVVISHADPASLSLSAGSHCGMVLSLAALAPLVRNIELACARRIPGRNEALRLLVKYLDMLQRDVAVTSPAVASAAATHIHDLAAIASGATGDGVELAAGRGIRAARLAAIKGDIRANLANGQLSVTAIAKRHGITPRYVHMLLEADGMSFTRFVLRERLALAHRMLCDPRQDQKTITAIAMEAGFGDLSYFNRAFRRRYGTTPRQIRCETAISDTGFS
jgi:AraC-like DNA-binding protein